MARPPADADPGKFIIGAGLYDNLTVARAYSDARVFRIDPRPLPVVMILINNLVFVAFFGGIAWLVSTSPPTRATLAYTAIASVAAITCIGYTVVVCYRFVSENRRGPWLVYDKSTGRLELPRHQRAFDRERIVHLQYITTKYRHSNSDSDPKSELNLITSDGDRQDRWSLLRSIFAYGAFDSIASAFVQETDLPVVRVAEQLAGRKVTEAPFEIKGDHG